MREAQGQATPVTIEYIAEVGEDDEGSIFETRKRAYVFKKLRRKQAHKVLYSLVSPFLRVV